MGALAISNPPKTATSVDIADVVVKLLQYAADPGLVSVWEKRRHHWLKLCFDPLSRQRDKAFAHCDIGRVMNDGCASEGSPPRAEERK